MAIDYGRYPMADGKLPNRNPETNIRYGIISQHKLADWVLDEMEPQYTFGCPECGQELNPGDHEEGNDTTCPTCANRNPTDEWWAEEPYAHTIDHPDGVIAELDAHGDLWVYQSLTVVWASHASPCAPGAGYLNGGTDVRAYGLPEDWLA